MKALSVILVFCLAVLFNASGQTTPQEMLNKAIYEEEVNGNLEEAIKLFLEIVDKNSTNRTVTAEAFYHLGLTNEKLGNKKAKEYYEKVINNFEDQPEFVRIAKERLNRLLALQEVPLIPTFTKIQIPTEISWAMTLSPDGKKLALGSDKKLWKLPLSGNLGPEFSGIPVQINTEGIKVAWSGLAWSGNGKWIAFNEPLTDKQAEEKWNQSIYIVSSDGGKPKKIVEINRDERNVNYRISLSPEGKKLAYTSIEDNKQHIQIISVEGGNPKQLTETQAREPVYSPDGKMIAYVKDKMLGRGEGELGLWVIPAQGGIPHLVADAGKASSPVWSPYGKMIAFLDYSLRNQINIVPVSKAGEAKGKVTRIDIPEGIETKLLAGWTPDNKIGILLSTKFEFALYTLSSKGGQAAMILYEGQAIQPRWSRDGKQIFYAMLPKEGNNKEYRIALASVSANGGSGKFLPNDPEGKIIRQLGFQSGNRISPDGKMIISAAWTSEDIIPGINFPQTKIWKIPVDGEESTQITNNQDRYADFCPSWSPDGKTIVFVRTYLLESRQLFGESSIYTVNSSGGVPNLIITEPDKFIFSLVWSPDGQMIAYLTKEKELPNKKLLKIINVNNGISRLIVEIQGASVNTELAWSPDSKRIAFNDRDEKVIKIMSLNDGSIEDIETSLVNVHIYHLDWSPDGEKFVFVGVKGGEDEFWFMENFLPATK